MLFVLPRRFSKTLISDLDSTENMTLGILNDYVPADEEDVPPESMVIDPTFTAGTIIRDENQTPVGAVVDGIRYFRFDPSSGELWLNANKFPTAYACQHRKRSNSSTPLPIELTLKGITVEVPGVLSIDFLTPKDWIPNEGNPGLIQKLVQTFHAEFYN